MDKACPPHAQRSFRSGGDRGTWGGLKSKGDPTKTLKKDLNTSLFNLSWNAKCEQDKQAQPSAEKEGDTIFE